MLFAVRVDIDVYNASGNIVHIAVKPSWTKAGVAPTSQSVAKSHKNRHEFVRVRRKCSKQLARQRDRRLQRVKD
ncbi:hypothetical protein AVEN_59317-1 [Araneus ventricosus]|uniref:Uncharacterized protein n=1 Tax=Araneus ventricosus TaxID=182803 RepID=A0A4Y2QBR2_ARAVE|nr:hypothetical protein AVEN_59317-1 [Araneus ventricosus]